MVLEEDKKEIKEKILSAYLVAKPDTKFSRLIRELGIGIGIALLDEFWGQVIVVPTRASLQRSALPQIIREELSESKIGSDQFKIRVKNLSRFYKLPKRAILEMNKKGKYSR